MITVNDFKNKENFFLMAGPCVIGRRRYGVAYRRKGCWYY